jgi:hypothetical protein
MKRFLLLLIIVLTSSCGGGSGSKEGVDERELYGKRRVDCKSTKTTDEGANITQCSQIRPDSKELKNLNNNFEDKPKKSGQFVDPQP